MKKIVVCTVLVLTALFLYSTIALTEDNRIIRPKKNRDDIRLSSSIYPEALRLPELERKAMQEFYAQGFWDALTLVQDESRIAKNLFRAYDGMTVGQVEDTMHRNSTKTTPSGEI